MIIVTDWVTVNSTHIICLCVCVFVCVCVPFFTVHIQIIMECVTQAASNFLWFGTYIFVQHNLKKTILPLNAVKLDPFTSLSITYELLPLIVRLFLLIFFLLFIVFIVKAIIMNFTEYTCIEILVYCISPLTLILISPLTKEIYFRTEKNENMNKHTHTHTQTETDIFILSPYIIQGRVNKLSRIKFMSTVPGRQTCVLYQFLAAKHRLLYY